MKLVLGFLDLFIIAVAHAAAIEARETGLIISPECLVIEIVVHLLAAWPTATEFCESVLAPTVSVTTTT